MELPDIGKQCNEPSCRQLDFLPLKCEVCRGSFCSDHYKIKSQAAGADKGHECIIETDSKAIVCPICRQVM
jgi:hypothetical protein